LRQTQERVLRLIKSCQILLVLTKTHEQVYADQVSDSPFDYPGSPATQPGGRCRLFLMVVARLRQMNPQGVVAFFPSGYYFANNGALTDHMEIAFISAEARPDTVVLLGITPDSLGVEYGWIEPGHGISSPRLPCPSLWPPFLGEAVAYAGFGLVGARLSLE
jgi:mannose-1-phosphate guanylyltransferase